MSGQKLISFEVYYLQNGRWQIHARFGPNDREKSIEEAKRLDTGGFEASCVVREAFNDADNTSEESVVYYTPTLKSRPPVGQITRASSGGKGGVTGEAPEGSAAANAMKEAKKREQEFDRKQKAEAAEREKKTQPEVKPPAVPQPKERDAIGEIIIKVVLVCAVSLVPAGLILYASIHSIAWAREQGVGISNQAAQITLIAVFILAFAAFFVPMLRKYVTFGTKKIGDTEPAVSSQTPLLDKIVPVRDRDGLEPSVALNEPVPLDEMAANLTALEKEVGPKKIVYEADPDLPPEEAEVAGELAITPVHGEGGGDPEAMSNELERMELEARRVVGPNIDDYTRFGLTLFFAGAGEALSRKFKIIGKAALDVLVKRVISLGNTEKLARGFIANIEEYLLEDRYFGMYRRGRSAAYRRIVDPNAPLGLDEALNEWRKPVKAAPGKDDGAVSDRADKPEKHQTGEKFVAVFFTDIVDSTAKQQKNGDHWMMDVIRAHNEIVREGIKKHAGREIKHTGDGIMATFPAAHHAIEASILMQRGFKRFSSVMPDRQFEVRVGISAGEPIHESGDIFGTPVNLAARVLSKTDPNQICVSSIVKDLCQGKGYQFQPHGTFELKGFPEAQVIYQVLFSVPDAMPLVAPQPAAGARADKAEAKSRNRPRVAA